MTAVLGEALMTDVLSVTRLQAEAPNQPPMGPLRGARTEEAVLPTTGGLSGHVSTHRGHTAARRQGYLGSEGWREGCHVAGARHIFKPLLT